MPGGWRPRRRWLALLTATALLAAGAGVALAAYPQGAPNDPGYDPAEQGGLATCAQRSVNSEQHYLYSFMPRCAPLARDPESSAGMSVDKAWASYTTGDPRTVIAYIEGGINWHQGDVAELADRVFLNKGELPPPTTPRAGRRTCSPGALCAADYSDTPDANHNDVVDPEDIIRRFSDGRDDDHNGFVDDISGWDFYDHQNDPATVDSAYDHANGQMEQAAAQTNNGIGTAGVCPDCMVMPIKAGAEALDRSDDLAQAWLYAAHMGVDVLVSTTADLGYSSFMDQAVKYAWRHNVVMAESSQDFDSTDHQGGMFHPYVLPGNGLVANSQLTLGDNPAANAITTTYRARSGYTAWGTHNVFSAATQGGTTSESTPTIGGVMALVRAYGREAARKGLIRRPLSADEAIQVVRATASDIASTPNPGGWPAKPGWDLQYGYGRPNVYRALSAIHAGDIPPESWISSPTWYSLYDPTTRKAVTVRGHVAAPRSSRYRWQLQYAPGGEPSDAQFKTLGSGRGTKPFTGKLGTLRLSRLPRSFWAAAYHLSPDKELSTSEQYTVTLRLRVFDEKGRMAEDRRSVYVHHDPSLLPHFPIRIGAGGEAQPQLADLQGRGNLALVFGDSDGVVRAIDGKTGKELPGWPVHTLPVRVQRRYAGVDPGHEPVVDSVAVGDLDGNGKLSVVAATTTGRVYVWNAHGKLRPGWPKALDRGVRRPPIPRPAKPFTRLPIQGASSPPVLYDLTGNGQLDILQSAWDGHVYAWRPNGRSLPGWPIDPTLGSSSGGSNIVVNDQKIDLPPAIAELDGDPRPEVVVKAQDNSIPDAGLQVGGAAHLHAYNANGSPVPGWPVTAQSLIMYYGSAQEFITEGVSSPVAAPVGGGNRDEVAFAPGIFSPTYLLRGDGKLDGIYGPVPNNVLSLVTDPATLLAQLQGGTLPTDAPVNFTTSASFGKVGGGPLDLVEPMTGAASTALALLAPGSGSPINSYMTAFNAQAKLPLPGFPSRAQGLDFLGVADVGDVTGDGRGEIVEGGDSNAVHAFTASGAQAPGFPKFTTGWVLFAPTLGDVNGDGRTDLVAATREGYVFAWRTNGDAAADDQWWSASHDEWNSARYETDSRPPGALRRVGLNRRGDKLTFKAPGDDWYAGEVDHYVAVVGPPCGRGTRRVRLGPNAAAGKRQVLRASKGEVISAAWAVDDAGNRGPTWRSGVTYNCPRQQ